MYVEYLYLCLIEVQTSRTYKTVPDGALPAPTAPPPTWVGFKNSVEWKKLEAE